MGRGGEEGIIKKKTSFYDSCQDIVNSLEAQWLGLCTSTAGAWLRSLVGVHKIKNKEALRPVLLVLPL